VPIRELLRKRMRELVVDLRIEDVDERKMMLLAERGRDVDRRRPAFSDDDLPEPLTALLLQLERATEHLRRDDPPRDEDGAEASAPRDRRLCAHNRVSLREPA